MSWGIIIIITMLIMLINRNSEPNGESVEGTTASVVPRHTYATHFQY